MASATSWDWQPVPVKRGGDARPERALVSDSAPGLAIHFAGKAERTWNVTHAASGLAILYGCRSAREAQEAALELAALGDFTRSADAITADPDLVTACGRVRAKALAKP